jgi:rare lipoprotein A
MKMRKQRAHVISPPVAIGRGAFWLPGFALLAYLAVAVWSATGHQTLLPASAASLVFPVSGSDSILRGQATWYGAELHGEPTASGEPFDMYGLTAAHRTLPLGSRAQVTNPATGRSVVVRINDRGPGRAGVMIDLSYGAAQAIGLKGSGPVEVTPLGR